MSIEEPTKDETIELLELENHLRQEIDQHQAIISQLCTKCDVQRMVIQALTKMGEEGKDES